MIKAVIFDIDGTLIDSNAAHAESFVQAFKKYGKDAPFEELKRLIGMGADDILEKYLSEEEIDQFGENLKDYRKEIYLNDYLPELKTFPKMRELFKKIKADGKQIALASSASEDELEEYHKKLNLNGLYEAETNSDDTEEAKPAPDIFQAALAKLKNVEKETVVVVGDTPYDAMAARKAGLQIVGVESGGWSREKLLKEGCVEVYKDIGEIFDDYRNSILGK